MKRVILSGLVLVALYFLIVLTGDYRHKEFNMFKAVQLGDIDHIESVIKLDPRLLVVKDERGWTPLHYAARWNRVDSANLLLNYGAELKLRDFSGRTPLDLAKEYESQEMVSYLENSIIAEKIGKIRFAVKPKTKFEIDEDKRLERLFMK